MSVKPIYFLLKAVVINEQTNVDRASGIYTVISSLEYMPTKEDKNAEFTCTVTYDGPAGQETLRSESVAFDVHCKFINTLKFYVLSFSDQYLQTVYRFYSMGQGSSQGLKNYRSDGDLMYYDYFERLCYSGRF